MLNLVKERCSLLPDFYEQAAFFFNAPTSYDEAAVKPKWDEAKKDFFTMLIRNYTELEDWEIETVENTCKQLATEKNIKIGELQMILRVMLVGSKMGPGVFAIASAIGQTDTCKRIENAIAVFG